MLLAKSENEEILKYFCKMKYLFITYYAYSRGYREAFKTWSLTQGIYSLVGKGKKVDDKLSNNTRNK